MTLTRVTAFACAGLLLAGGLHGDQPAGDPVEQRLQGEWMILAVERDGTADLEPVGGLLVFTRNQLEYQPPMVRFPTGSVSVALSLGDLSPALF